jgi:hypothetical protein
MESQVTDDLVHDTRALTWLSILVRKGIMNQIVHDLAFHIRPEGHHEPSGPRPGLPY